MAPYATILLSRRLTIAGPKKHRRTIQLTILRMALSQEIWIERGRWTGYHEPWFSFRIAAIAFRPRSSSTRSGTLNLLEESAVSGVAAFVFASTTSVFGDALVPPAGAPATWIIEEVVPIPRNIYGVTKVAAETLCQLFYRTERVSCIVLRLSRFFPEEDLDAAVRAAYSSDNYGFVHGHNLSLYRSGQAGPGTAGDIARQAGLGTAGRSGDGWPV